MKIILTERKFSTNEVIVNEEESFFYNVWYYGQWSHHQQLLEVHERFTSNIIFLHCCS